jgi:hypothetical protein
MKELFHKPKGYKKLEIKTDGKIKDLAIGKHKEHKKVKL